MSYEVPVQCDSATDRKGIPSLRARWMNPEDITLSEMGPAQKNKYCVSSLCVEHKMRARSTGTVAEVGRNPSKDTNHQHAGGAHTKVYLRTGDRVVTKHPLLKTGTPGRS